jgi:DNA polymerase-1
MDFAGLAPKLYNGVRRVSRPCLRNVERIDNGMIPMVVEMMRVGFLVDADHFRRLDTELAIEEELVLDGIEALTGARVNPNSSQQVGALLLDDLGLLPPGMRRSRKTGAVSMDDDTLSSLTAAHPVVPLIQQGRELKKLRGTYCQPIPRHVGRDDRRIHTTLKPYHARTGRLASENPNLQNIPVRGKWGKKVRAGFIARPGCVLSSLDLSQIEMVWAAELSRDLVMLEVYNQGQDLHVRTACALFGLDYGEIAPLWARYKKGELTGADLARMRDFEVNKRLPAKTLGFAVLYGVTPVGLQIQIMAAGGPVLTEEQCEEYIESWFRLFSGVRRWMSQLQDLVQFWGMVWTAFGRPRLLPEAQSAVRWIRQAGLRQAGNTPVQGTAGDHLKIAMAEIYDGPVAFYRSLGVVCDPILQIHDELIFELGKEIAEEFNAWASAIMCAAVRPMACRVKSSSTIAENWGDLK